MQDRLAQQQKATAEERAYLKEIISRMDSQLSEQQRQLEKVTVKSDCSDLAATQQKCMLYNSDFFPQTLNTPSPYTFRNAGR